MTKRTARMGLLAVVCCCTAFASPTLTLTTNNGNLGGNLAGGPGQTVGWGYTITNDPNSSFFLVIIGSAFCNAPGDPINSICTSPGTGPTFFGPQFGTYTDYIGQQSPPIVVGAFGGVVGPTGFVAGNPTTSPGVGEYLINANAPLLASDSGNLFVFYNIWDSNPLVDPNAIQDPNDPGNLEISAAASVTVVAVPEPATFLLAGGALLALAGLRRSQRF